MKNNKLSLCQRCWCMTKTLVRDICGKCKKPKELTKREADALKKKAHKAIDSINLTELKESNYYNKGLIDAYGGSDY